jgi:MOSC domain-containing protein YiiM
LKVLDFVPRKSQGHILAVCAGREKGQPKRNVGQGQLLKNFGLSGDCDTGPASTQLVLLCQGDQVLETAPKESLGYGSLGENLVITLDLTGLPLGTRLRSQDALIELTSAQAPLFTAKVLLPGIVTVGDPIIIE